LYTRISFDYETLEQLNSNLINDTIDLIISKEFVLKISAYLLGGRQISCYLRVKIQNLNDNKPKFTISETNYNIFISNDSLTIENMFITKLYVYDIDIVAKDQNLEIALIDSYNHSFRVDSISGSLYFIPKNYDNRKRDAFSLKIIVNDTLFSTLVTINVNIEMKEVESRRIDEEKVFNYNCSINEDALPGTHVITLNTIDGFKYYILNGDLYNQFELNSKNGKLYTRLLLDREFISFYNLDVLAVGLTPNSKYISRITILINDINDNRPVCNDSLRVLNAQNMVNAQFSAYDADSITKFNFNLITKEQLPVKIDRSSGVLNINNAFQSSNFITNYNFYVKVSDQDNYYCLIRVKITLNNYQQPQNALEIEPHFSKYVFVNQIYENAQKYSLIDVLNINERSLYGLVKFSSISDNTNIISLDPKFGYLQVNTDTFDRELIGNWLNFTVQVGLSTSNYYLEILDRNDNLPHFIDSAEELIDLEENLDENSLIFKLHAVDGDKNSKVLYKILTRENNC
jgi:hypothetical protein